MKITQDYIPVGYPILTNSYQAGVLPAVIFPFVFLSVWYLLKPDQNAFLEAELLDFDWETHGNVKIPMVMAALNDDFIFYEDVIDAEIRALENENFDLGETFYVCEGFETDQMILCEKLQMKLHRRLKRPLCRIETEIWKSVGLLCQFLYQMHTNDNVDLCPWSTTHILWEERKMTHKNT